MKALTRKHTIIAVLTFVIFCGTGIGLARFGKSMEVRRNRVIAAKQQLASYELNRKIFAEESEQFKKIAARLGVLESYRVTSESIPELLSSLEALAQGNNVEFSITTVQTPSNGSGQKLVIDFSAHGSFSSIKAFLDMLNHQTYQISFNSFSLYAGTDTTQAAVPAPVAAGAAPAVVKPVTPTTPMWDLLASIEVLSF